MKRYLYWWLTNKKIRHRRHLPVLIIGGIMLISLYAFTKETAINHGAEPTSLASSYTCTLAKLSDGDSFSANCHQKNGPDILIKTRIWGIDAPEMGQKPWGNLSKSALKQMLEQNTFELEILEKDRYGRYVSKIYKDQADLGLEMIKKGQAIVYYRYNKDPNYKKYENEAKIAGIGVWSKKGAHQNPEKWRRLNAR